MQLAAANDNGADQTADLKDQLTAEDLKRLGVRVAANDNGALGAVSPKTLKVINTRQLSRAVRVYNLEIESRPGEITHNYLVGDQLVWVHNQPKDKRFGLPKTFWRWYHRVIKPGRNGQDCDIGEALEYHDEWLREGKPDADSKRGGRRRRRR